MKLRDIFDYSGNIVELYRKSTLAHELGHAATVLHYGHANEAHIHIGNLAGGEGARCNWSWDWDWGVDDDEQEFLSEQEQAEIALAGAAFAIFWMHDFGVRFKSGMGFREYWFNAKGLDTDKTIFGMFCEGYAVGELEAICYKNSARLYKQLGGRVWVASMAKNLVSIEREGKAPTWELVVPTSAVVLQDTAAA